MVALVLEYERARANGTYIPGDKDCARKRVGVPYTMNLLRM